MGCNCSKNAKPTGFGSNDRSGQSRSAHTPDQAQESAPLNGAQQQAAAAGAQQSFTLRDRAGKVQSFGSRLERSAFQTRNGGTII